MLGSMWDLIDPRTLTVRTNSDSVSGLPAIGRGLALYGGLIGQANIDQVRGAEVVTPRPRILQQPDVAMSRTGFVSDSVQEWLMHGNSCSLITARDSRGLPAATKWFPAWQWDAPINEPDYYRLNGQKVRAEDVTHVKRGSDPKNPRRGVGIVEQHMKSLERALLQESYESNNLSASGVPSVAVIAPQKELTQTELDQAGEAWLEKFSGPRRVPGIFPNGTDIKTLSWSPNDQQMVLARQLTLTDVANMLNLDPYWLGAPGSSHNYKSPGGMFVSLLRISLEPVLAEFEDVWSRSWFPYGSQIRFDRVQLTRDDFATAVVTGVQAVNNGLMTTDEWRTLNGLPPLNLPETTTLRDPSTTPTPDLPVEEPTTQQEGTS